MADNEPVEVVVVDPPVAEPNLTNKPSENDVSMNIEVSVHNHDKEIDEHKGMGIHAMSIADDNDNDNDDDNDNDKMDISAANSENENENDDNNNNNNNNNSNGNENDDTITPIAGKPHNIKFTNKLHKSNIANIGSYSRVKRDESVSAVESTTTTNNIVNVPSRIQEEDHNTTHADPMTPTDSQMNNVDLNQNSNEDKDKDEDKHNKHKNNHKHSNHSHKHKHKHGHKHHKHIDDSKTRQTSQKMKKKSQSKREDTEDNFDSELGDIGSTDLRRDSSIYIRNDPRYSREYTRFEGWIYSFVQINAIFQLLLDIVLEVTHLVPRRINHLALTLVNAFLAMKTLSAIRQKKFKFLHEDVQVLALLEVCLIFGDLFVLIDASCLKNYSELSLQSFFYARMVFIVFSLYNFVVAIYIMKKYSLYHLYYVGDRQEDSIAIA